MVNQLTMKKILLVFTILLISFSGFSQSRYISETVKKIVYTRDGGKCQCCGSFENLEYDHIMPYSCGGASDASNIQLLCMKCNRSKSNSCYCKVHDKKVGYNCCDGDSNVQQSSGSSSGNKRTSSVATQCTGTTKKGTRCKNMTTNPNGRCHLH